MSQQVTAPRTFAAACDLLCYAAAAIIVLVFATGGGTWTVDELRISITRTANPVIAGAFIALLRGWRWPHIPFVGFKQTTPARFAAWSERLLATLVAPGAAVSWRRVLAAVIAGSVLLRLLSAWLHPGFVTGDDVELHEMTLASLLGREWDVWNLRNPFYPMTFLYPAQRLARMWVGDDVMALVVAGRLVVVAAATLTIWLIYRIGLALTASVGTAVLAAALFATGRLHLWFASSELPRPVAAVFITAACWMLLGARTRHAVAAGVLLGIGGSLRVGELIFFVPAGLHLLLERRLPHAAALAAAGAATAALCLGVADWLYWGEAFSSLRHLVVYTLVERQSSRGFEPALYYLTHLGEWTTPVVAGLALLAAPIDRRVALWAWLPVLLLSVLPHKEARYLIAAQPFVCLLAAMAVHAVAQGRHRWLRPAVLVFLLLAAMVFELSNWRMRRTDDGVALARAIAASAPDGVAAQQLWRFGGRLYWGDIGTLIELPDVPIDPAALAPAVTTVVLLRALSTSAIEGELGARGFRRAETVSGTAYVTFVR